MQINPFFLIKQIDDTIFLLPFGQAIADHRRGLTLNDTALHFWNMMQEAADEEDLLCSVTSYYEIDAVSDSEDYEMVRNDIHAFLTQLRQISALSQIDALNQFKLTELSELVKSNESNQSAHIRLPEGADNFAKINALTSSLCTRYFQIAGLLVSITAPARLISSNFDLFEIPLTNPDSAEIQLVSPEALEIQLHINVVEENGGANLIDCFDLSHALPLLRNYQLNVDLVTLNHSAQSTQLTQLTKPSTTAYFLQFPSNRCITACLLSSEGDSASFQYIADPLDAQGSSQAAEELFHAIRIAFLYLAQKHNMVAIHSASILYREKAWLFSGQSGAGKSTHTALWHELWGTPFINGDLNLLTWEEGNAYIQGIPWCGTSGLCDNQKHPLGGITLLEQSPQNQVSSPSTALGTLLVNQRLISPSWTKELFDQNWLLTQRIVPNILISQLQCTKESSAAILMREYVDGYLDAN